MSTERKKTEQAAAPRRPYERPAVVSDEVFETMALSCGKIAGTQQACNMQRKTS